jgi:hypothetical protein
MSGKVAVGAVVLSKNHEDCVPLTKADCSNTELHDSYTLDVSKVRSHGVALSIVVCGFHIASAVRKF